MSANPSIIGTNLTAYSNDLLGFVPEPTGRGTFGIIWSCIAVLFLNTWTVLHINVPPADRSKWRCYLHKMKWLLIIAIVPDGIVATAFSQWRYARRSVKEMKECAPWWTVLHGHYAEMGGYKVQDDSSGQQYIFRASQLAWLAQENLLAIPEVSAEDINDRSKTGQAAKFLACAQSAWFLVQAFARVGQRLPLTTFEVATIPFVGCTWLTYFFWWDKPMDMDTCTIIHVPKLHPDDLRTLAKSTCFPEKGATWYRPVVREVHNSGWDFYWWENLMSFRTCSIIRVNHLIPHDLHTLIQGTAAEARVAHWYRSAVNETQSSDWDYVDDIVIFLVGWFFNGVHLMAWNNTFPTHTESILWKVSVCLMLAYIGLVVPFTALLAWLPSGSIIKGLPIWCITLCYVITRLYLVAEVFIGFRALPAAAFSTVNWALYFPHIF